MKTEITTENFAELGLQSTVYVKAVAREEVETQLREANVSFDDSVDTVFAVHAANGSPLALLDDRDAAFAAARTYNMEPVSVH